jgi:Domain of unknown function (DUF6457)
MDPLDRLAQALSVEAATPAETGAILNVARDVAHTLERRITPVSTFLLGIAVQRRVEAGSTRAAALDEALADLRTALPADPTPGERSQPAE